MAQTARALGIAVEQPERINDLEVCELIERAGAGEGEQPERAEADEGEGGHGEGGQGGHPPDSEQAARAMRTTTPPRGVREEALVLVVCAFGALIKEPLLSAYPLLNVHPSLLPRWRGAAPIERAIMAGDAQTGVSIMRLTEGLDSGPVCAVAAEPIGPRDTYGSLAERLRQLGGELLVGVLDDWERGRPPRFAEQLEEGATYAEKIGAEDRLLDPERSAVELDRQVRALHPHIGARVALADGTLLGVCRAALVGDGSPEDDPERLGPPEAGAVERGLTAREGRLLLGCATGALELLEIQPPGGRPMDGASYLRGHGLPGA